MSIPGMRRFPVELPVRSPAQFPVEIAGAMALMFFKEHFADSAFLYKYVPYIRQLGCQVGA